MVHALRIIRIARHEHARYVTFVANIKAVWEYRKSPLTWDVL